MVNTEQSSVSSIRACPSWLRSQQWKTTELQSFQDMPGNVENASEGGCEAACFHSLSAEVKTDCRGQQRLMCVLSLCK